MFCMQQEYLVPNIIITNQLKQFLQVLLEQKNCSNILKRINQSLFFLVVVKFMVILTKKTFQQKKLTMAMSHV